MDSRMDTIEIVDTNDRRHMVDVLEISFVSETSYGCEVVLKNGNISIMTNTSYDDFVANITNVGYLDIAYPCTYEE